MRVRDSILVGAVVVTLTLLALTNPVAGREKLRRVGCVGLARRYGC